MLDINWATGDGDWNTASNWSPQNVPDSPGETAVVPAGGGSLTITMGIAPNIDELRLDNSAALFLPSNNLTTSLGFRNAGTTRVVGSPRFAGPVNNLLTGRIEVPAGNLLQTSGGAWTNDGRIEINSNSGPNNAYLNLQGNLTIAGSGALALNGSGDLAYISSNGTRLTNGSAHTIRGKGRVNCAVTNEGRIEADVAGASLELRGADKTNNGLMAASAGGILDLAGISVANNGQIASSGGGVVRMFDSGVVGGTMSGQVAVLSGGNNRITSLTSAADIGVFPGSYLRPSGTITNSGTITVNPNMDASGAFLYLDSASTFEGTGAIVLGAPGDSSTIYSNGSTLTNGSQHAIRGQGRINVPLVNLGTVAANVPSASLELRSYDKTNAGTMHAVGGASLDVYSVTITNDGTITTSGAGRARLFDAAIVGGTLDGQFGTYTGGNNRITDLNFQGTFDIGAGTYLRPSGTIVNAGTITLNPAAEGIVTMLYADRTVLLDGSGQVVLNAAGNHATVESNGVLVTNGASHTIRGQGRISCPLTNLGLVSADVAGKSLELRSNAMTNSGLIRAASGGILDVIGIRIANDGAVVSSESGGVVRLDDATISGGILRGEAATIGGATNRIQNLAFSGTFGIGNGTYLRPTGTIVNGGTIVVNPSQGTTTTMLYNDAAATFQGPGEIVLNAPGNRAQIDSNGTLFTNAAGHTVRGQGRIACPFSNAGTVAADLPGASLLLDSANMTNTGTISAPAGFLDVGSIIVQNADGRFTSTGSGAVRIAGTSLVGGSVDGTLICRTSANNRVSNLSLSGQVDILAGAWLRPAGTIVNDALITVNSDGGASNTLLYAESPVSFSGGGSIVLNASGAYAQIDSNGSVITNGATHTVRGQGTIAGAFTNEGTVWADRDSQLVLDASSFRNLGLVSVTGPGGLRISNGNNFVNEGRVEIDILREARVFNARYRQTAGKTEANGTLNASGREVVVDGGSLIGDGRVIATTVRNTAGTVSGGSTTGKLTVEGDLVLSTGAKVLAEIAGTSRGSQYDLVESTGTATLAGELEIRFIEGFVPQLGDSFELVRASSVSGQFERLRVIGLPDSEIQVTYNPDSVVLVIIPGWLKPLDYTVVRGVEVGAHDVVRLERDDVYYVDVEQRFQFAPTVANAEMRAVFSVPNPGTLTGATVAVRVKANSVPFDHNSCRQEVALKNQSTGLFEVVDTRKPTSGEQEVSVALNALQRAKYISLGGSFEASVRVYHLVPALPAWKMQVDQVRLTVTR